MQYPLDGPEATGVAVEESSFEILRILDGYECFIAKSSRSRYVQPKET